MSKINVLLLFGGQSEEHEVSIMSARNVAKALDSEKYEIKLVGIDRNGAWHKINDPKILEDSNLNLLKLSDGEKQNLGLMELKEDSQIDVVFPLLHGPNGEDGTIQGLLKLMGLPFVGSSVLGSAVNMDKDVAKRLLQQVGIPTPKFVTFRYYEKNLISYLELRDKLGEVMFVKPANLGSSVGVNKVKSDEELSKAVEEAFKFDNKILIEEAIVGREIECAVLGNESPIVSVPGEIISNHEFYDYEAKYIDENGAKLIIPAVLDEEIVIKAKNLAKNAYKVLECEGLARVDMFLKETGDIYINEINTIPGFTNRSMYPKLMELTGISQNELVDQLIKLAFEKNNRHVDRQ